jgi:hypothetical protein
MVAGAREGGGGQGKVFIRGTEPDPGVLSPRGRASVGIHPLA